MQGGQGVTGGYRGVLGGCTRNKQAWGAASGLAVCRCVSALRSVTTQVYTVLASTLVKLTAGGNTRSHGTGLAISPPPGSFIHHH